jgi:hypothetical protein
VSLALTLTGLTRARALEPRLVGAIDASRLALDLAADLARDDIGVDEGRAGVTVRGRAPFWRVVDKGVTRRFPGKLSFSREPPSVLKSKFADQCAGRSDRNAARSSVAKSSGSSHAAKWPPFLTSLK